MLKRTHLCSHQEARGKDKGSKLSFSLILVLVLLTACGTPGQMPPGDMPPPSQDPPGLTTSITGTVPNPAGATHIIAAHTFVVTTPEGDIEFRGFHYSAPVTDSGEFTINLSAPPPDELIYADLCGDGEFRNIAMIGLFLTSSMPIPESIHDITHSLFFGSEQNQADAYQVAWIYVDEDYQYQGECGGFANMANLNLEAGWNTVLITLTSGETVPIPVDARWFEESSWESLRFSLILRAKAP